MDSVPDPIDCLLSCSGSPYAESDILPGPPHTSRKGVLAITGWEKVTPSAVYDLTATASQEPRRRKRQSNNQDLLRDVVSMPNLCTKADFEAQKWSYMSGQLDEGFSYVYTGGLSERSCKANPENEYKKLSHDSQRTSVSMCNLTLDPASLHVFSTRRSAYYIEPMTQCKEISKMQPKSEHLQVENRLRNVDLNVCPDLQKANIQSSGREKSDIEGTDTVSLAHAKSSQTRKLRRQRRPQPKIWHPPPPNEEPHHQLLLPVDISSDTRPQANKSSSKHPNSIVTVNGTTRLHNQFSGYGSFHHAGAPGKQPIATCTHVQNPRNGKKSSSSKSITNHREKQRTITYHIIFDQDRCTRGSRLPQAQDQASKQEYSQTIPVFVPSLEQEQAMIPKRFSKLAALQMKSSAPNSISVITDRLLYSE